MPFSCADQQEEDGDECIAQVPTHIGGLLSSDPDLRGAKLPQAEMIRELARLQVLGNS